MKMQASFENTTVFTEKKQLMNYLRIIEGNSSVYILKTLIPIVLIAAAVCFLIAKSVLAWVFAVLSAAAVIYRFADIRIRFTKRFGRGGEAVLGNPVGVKAFDSYLEQTCTVTVRKIEYGKITKVIAVYDCVIIFYKDTVLCISDSGYTKGDGKSFRRFLADKIDSSGQEIEFKVSDGSVFDI